MRKILLVIILIAVVLGFIFFRINDYHPALAKLKDISGVCELKYKVFALGLLPIGEAEFAIPKEEEYKGRQVLHLSATAKNLDYLSTFFNGYAVLDSFMDKNNFCAFEFKQKLVLSGKPDVYKEAFYDQEKGTMTIGEESRQIYPNTQDPLSLLANIRRMDFEKTKEFEFNINTNRKNYVLKGTAQPGVARFKGKNYGIYLVKVNIARKDNNPRHKSQLDLVLLRTKDDNIPLMIKVFAGGFLITVRLEKVTPQ